MTHPRYVASIGHITPDGDDVQLAEGESRTRSLRVLRTEMKRYGRSLGIPFYIFVLKRSNAPYKPATQHYFDCMAGRDSRRAVAA